MFTTINRLIDKDLIRNHRNITSYLLAHPQDASPQHFATGICVYLRTGAPHLLKLRNYRLLYMYMIHYLIASQGQDHNYFTLQTYLAARQATEITLALYALSSPKKYSFITKELLDDYLQFCKQLPPVRY